MESEAEMTTKTKGILLPAWVWVFGYSFVKS